MHAVIVLFISNCEYKVLLHFRKPPICYRSYKRKDMVINSKFTKSLSKQKGHTAYQCKMDKYLLQQKGPNIYYFKWDVFTAIKLYLSMRIMQCTFSEP